MRTATLDENRCWEAMVARDAASDGRFFYGVLSTGVYCRPSCPSRKPRRENVSFYPHARAAEAAGLRPCLRCRPDAGDLRSERIAVLCRHIEDHIDERLTLRELGRQAGLSPFHLQRAFKAALGLTPRQYADACRMKALKRQLKNGHSVTRAIADAGFGSTSRAYERTDAQLGMTPSDYRRGARGIGIRYLTADTPAGKLLVAATGKGICAVQFGDSEAELVSRLRAEYPSADVAAADTPLAGWVQSLLHHLAGRQTRLDLPLDIRATAFQRRVWQQLQAIPYGATRSYSEVAAAAGVPAAVRAAANACASNPVAVVIPCHRVIRNDGGLGGYRWGLERKRKLLEIERRTG